MKSNVSKLKLSSKYRSYFTVMGWNQCILAATRQIQKFCAKEQFAHRGITLPNLLHLSCDFECEYCSS